LVFIVTSNILFSTNVPTNTVLKHCIELTDKIPTIDKCLYTLTLQVDSRVLGLWSEVNGHSYSVTCPFSDLNHLAFLVNNIA
jgi:hypothetical protein